MTFRRTAKSSITRSSQPRSVAVGDFNNDNQTDIAVINSGTNTIGIFLSNKDGTFADQETYSTGSESDPYSLVIGDFNNDNNLDIAVANYASHSIGIFLGFGNGTVGSQQLFSTGLSRPWFIAAGDFNSDNRSDIAVVLHGTDSIAIFLGYGNGSFQIQTSYFTGYDSLPYSLAVGDFNKDNQLDIAVVNYGTDNVGIFLGYDNGTLASQKTYTTIHNSNPSGIAVGDFNNDEKLDIVVANHGGGSAAIFLGHGDGTFAVQLTYSISSESRPQFVAVGYFHNDTYLDIVILDSENDQVHIFLGDGKGSFPTLTTYDLITDSRPMAVAVANFDNDNQSDIAVANYGSNNVLILSGYSSKPSARQTNYFVGRDSRPSSLAIYDFNNDDKLDLAVDNFNDNYILILNGTGNGSFVGRETYSTGNKSAPVYLCVSDLNNDNRIDIIIANVGTDCVGVLFGQDNGKFSTMTTYSTGTGSTPWSVAISDVNNDKYLDIISSNTGTSNIGVLLGRGDGTFAHMETYSTGIPSQPWSVAVGDVNNDNHLDIVAGISNPDCVGVCLGHGDGTFGMITTYSTGIDTYPFAVVLADFNRDNYLDIAVANTNAANIGIFLGNRDGTFREQVPYFTGTGSLPNYLTIIDFNNDDYDDIAVTNYGTDEIVILFGDGNGSFELQRTYSTGMGSHPFGINVVDLNNDKVLEIIVTFWGTGYIGVLSLYYAAKFSNQTTCLTGSAPHPYSVAAGDFNSDNRSDLAVVNSDSGELGILLGLGNGTFDAQVKYTIGTNSYPQYVITGDINQDSHLDTVTVNSKSSTISIMIGYGNGTFADQLVYSTGEGSHPYSMAMGDLNNDHHLDLVITNTATDSIGILFGFDYTSFHSQMTYLNGDSLAPNAVVVHDFNHDQHLDVAVVFRNSHNLAVLLGNGNGSFTSMATYLTGPNSFPSMLVVDDFNRDGQVDIVVANLGTNNIGVLLGYDNGSFATMITYSTGNGSTPRSLVVGDFNNDKMLDVVTVNSGANNIGLLLGHGNGSFALVITYSTGNGSNPYAAAIADFNNDGLLDIAVTHYDTSSVGIFLGYGNGSFQVQLVYSTGFQCWPSWVSIGDFNGDNRSDMAIANYNINNVGILLGYGNGSFATVVAYSSGDGSSPLCLCVNDFNDDQKLDIAVANYATSTMVVLFGLGDGTFLLGAAYSTGLGSSPSSLAVGDFDDDTRLDIVLCNYMSNTIGIFLRYSTEPFAGVTTYSTGDGSHPHSVVVADLNIDGWPDIIVTNYGTDSVGILGGCGNGVFNNMITYSTGIGSAPYSVAIADFNDDNRLDIVVTNSGADNVAVLLGYANGTFANAATYSTGVRSHPYAVAIGDFNNDNQSDIVIANSGTSDILVLYGYGNGTFGNETSYMLGYGYAPYSVAATDLNQDGWMDIAIACYSTDHVETLVKMC